MNVPQDKQTVVLLLEQLINQKQSIRYQDYNDRKAMSADRRTRDKFKLLSKKMLEKFKITNYSPNHFKDCAQSIERVVFREVEGLWTIDYMPGQYEPTEVHRAIFHLLRRYFDCYIGVPKAEVKRVTYTLECPYCGGSNRMDEQVEYFECGNCYANVMWRPQ